MYYLVWFIVGVAFCILVFLLLMVALGNKMAITLMWWTGWFFFWFGLFFWWFLCIGFKVLNWIVGFFYEFFCAGILFMLGGKRKHVDNNTTNKKKKSGNKSVKVEVKCQGPAEVTAVSRNHGNSSGKKLPPSSNITTSSRKAMKQPVSSSSTTGNVAVAATTTTTVSRVPQQIAFPPLNDTTTPAPIADMKR